MKFVLKSSLFAVVAIALASLTSCNASALEIYGSFTRSYNYSQSGLVWYGVTSDAAVDAWHTSIGINNNNGGIAFTPGLNTQPVYISRIVLVYTQSWGANAIANIPYRICFNNPSDMSAFVGFSGNGYSSVISNEFSYTSAGCFAGHVNVYVPKNLNNIYLGGGNGGTIIGSMPNNDGFTIVFGVTTFLNVPYHDYTDTLNAIKTNSDSIKTKLDEIKTSTDGVAAQEERVADVAEDEYNKTIQDEQTASQGAGGFSFNFALPNPFSIFQVSDGCVNTPTIDSWLHLEGDWKSPHCPLLPANIRNTLTPVVSLIVTLATLLVVIRWTSSSAVDVAGNSVAMNDNPKGDKK